MSGGPVDAVAPTSVQPTTTQTDPERQNSVLHSSPDDAPPSYQSLFGQIKEARETSTNYCDFIAKLFLMPLGLLIALVILVGSVGLVFGIPVTLLGVGSYYIYDCPLEPGIPIWMVVGGVFMFLHVLKAQREGDNSCFHVCLLLFYMAWYIAGAVFIYRNTWPEHYERDSEHWDDYCNYTLYMTAFVIVSIMSVIAGLLCCVSAS